MKKKELVINILKEFIDNNDNIFIKANNENIIINLYRIMVRENAIYKKN